MTIAMRKMGWLSITPFFLIWVLGVFLVLGSSSTPSQVTPLILLDFCLCITGETVLLLFGSPLRIHSMLLHLETWFLEIGSPIVLSGQLKILRAAMAELSSLQILHHWLARLLAEMTGFQTITLQSFSKALFPRLLIPLRSYPMKEASILKPIMDQSWSLKEVELWKHRAV